MSCREYTHTHATHTHTRTDTHTHTKPHKDFKKIALAEAPPACTKRNTDFVKGKGAFGHPIVYG